MIVAAAIRHQGKVWALPAPARHHNIIHLMVQQGATEEQRGLVHARGEQGFVDSDIGFVDRTEAARIAVAQGQVEKRRLHTNGQLYSEDLW